MDYVGTSGNDNLIGTRQDDTFDLTAGGDDRAVGKDGFDVFSLGGTLTNRDSIDGGDGDGDYVLLTGDYSAELTLSARTMVNVETISLGSGFNYAFTFRDSVVAAGAHLLIDGASLGSSEYLLLHAESETNGSYTVLGGAGDDYIFTGAGNDALFGGGGVNFLAPGSGEDSVTGGSYYDFIRFDGAGAFDAGDHVDGGDGFDDLVLNGDYSSGLAITPTMMVNVEKIQVFPGSSYTLDLTHLSAPASGQFTVAGGDLAAGDTLTVDASQLATSDGVSLQGGLGNDVLEGSAAPDFLLGGGGADTLQGHGGADQYVFDLAFESTGPNYDTIIGFDADDDFIAMTNIFGVDDPVTVGRLSAANFDSDLHAAINRHEMLSGHAVLFTPSRGTYTGELFLIVDRGGGAGYQAGLDLVIHLENAKHMVNFDIDNFGFGT